MISQITQGRAIRCSSLYSLMLSRIRRPRDFFGAPGLIVLRTALPFAALSIPIDLHLKNKICRSNR